MAGGEETEVSTAFSELYRQKALKAYPPLADGTTLLPFTRFFLVARRPSVLETMAASRKP